MNIQNRLINTENRRMLPEGEVLGELGEKDQGLTSTNW